MVPHLIAVKQDQANGLSPGSGQGIPHIAAGGAAAAVQRHIPVNGVAGSAGCIAAPRLNAVQRIICVGDTAIPGKMPAQILDVRRPGGSRAIGLVSTGNLRIKDGGVSRLLLFSLQNDDKIYEQYMNAVEEYLDKYMPVG